MFKSIVKAKTRNLVIELPKSFVGKTVEISCETIDDKILVQNSKTNISMFKGALQLSILKQKEFTNFVNESREEWNNPI